MTLAPRVEVFTQISCYRLHGHHNYNHTLSHATSTSSVSLDTLTSFYSSLDPHGPHIHPAHFAHENSIAHIYFVPPTSPPTNDTTGQTGDNDDDEVDDPRRLPSTRCLSDPAVQAGAARLQTIMTTTMGLLSALTTGWWGHFGERHGRTKVLAIATFGLFLTYVPPCKLSNTH